MRVLIPGMGGELGTTVARLLEENDAIDAICGMDLEPPRRWMRRAEFHFVRPDEEDRIAELVADFAPTALAYLWMFEPHARSNPTEAAERTRAGWQTVASALREHAHLDTIVVRSGVEVYGRGRGTRIDPEVGDPLKPSCRFGRLLHEIEDQAAELAGEMGASAAALRLAPVSGALMPSPLGRYLRLPVVPLPILPKPFSLVHQFDAATALAKAVEVGFDGALNVVAEGTETTARAVLSGGRVPLPTVGPFLRVTRLATELLGSPLPDHTLELLEKGRCAEPSDLDDALGMTMAYSTADVIRELYEWGRVLPIRPAGHAVQA